MLICAHALRIGTSMRRPLEGYLRWLQGGFAIIAISLHAIVKLNLEITAFYVAWGLRLHSRQGTARRLNVYGEDLGTLRGTARRFRSLRGLSPAIGREWFRNVLLRRPLLPRSEGVDELVVWG